MEYINLEAQNNGQKKQTQSEFSQNPVDTAKQKLNIRDFASINELAILSNIESMNAIMMIKKIKLLKTISLFLIMSIFLGCKINHSDIKIEKFSWYYKTRKIHKILIDTRSVKAYQKGYIPDAFNVHVLEPEFKKLVKSKLSPKATDVWIMFVYAQDAKGTEKLREKLSKFYKRHFPFKGPTVIYYLECGYEKWLELPENMDE